MKAERHGIWAKRVSVKGKPLSFYISFRTEELLFQASHVSNNRTQNRPRKIFLPATKQVLNYTLVKFPFNSTKTTWAKAPPAPCTERLRDSKWKQILKDFGECRKNSLIESFKMGPHLICISLHLRSLLWPASGSGLDVL